MSRRPPEARAVVDESTTVVHRTHDLAEAHALVVAWHCGPDHDDHAGDAEATDRMCGLPTWALLAGQGERVWLRVNPAPRDADVAYWYAAAAEGERGAFRAVVYSGEPERCRWWR